MLKIDDTTQVETPQQAPDRTPIPRKLVVAMATVLIVTIGVIVWRVDPTLSDHEPEPAPRSQDDVVRQLVDDGKVAAARLSDGTLLVGSGLATMRKDAVLRQLVQDGHVPAATLSDGTELTGPRLQTPPLSQDDIVRQLVAAGKVPAATLSDGTQVSG